MSDHNGFTTHEILVEIRDDLKEHIKDSQVTEIEINKALSARPTRGEVIRWIGGASMLVGLVMALS